jgi:hypothetical protein
LKPALHTPTPTPRRTPTRKTPIIKNP